MDTLKLYEISDEYINYLRKRENLVLSTKENTRVHPRKYLGVVYNINNYKYFIPLSSPKESDYQIVNGNRIIRKSIIPIVRIIYKNDNDELELKGTLKINNMIPVPNSELKLYDFQNEQDSYYKALVQKEILFIRKNRKRIINNANILYSQKMENNSAIGYLKNTINFSMVEKLHDEFVEAKLLEKLEHSRKSANNNEFKDATTVITELKQKYNLQTE